MRVSTLINLSMVSRRRTTMSPNWMRMYSMCVFSFSSCHACSLTWYSPHMTLVDSPLTTRPATSSSPLNYGPPAASSALHSSATLHSSLLFPTCLTTSYPYYLISLHLTLYHFLRVSRASSFLETGHHHSSRTDIQSPSIHLFHLSRLEQ